VCTVRTCSNTCVHCKDLLQHNITIAAAAAAAAADVLPGMGIQLDPEASPAPDGTPAFKAVVCNSGNHGLPGASYGLRVQPCIQCQRGMVTEDKYRSNVTGDWLRTGACYECSRCPLLPRVRL
jgi:hypothetical protein